MLFSTYCCIHTEKKAKAISPKSRIVSLIKKLVKEAIGSRVSFILGSIVFFISDTILLFGLIAFAFFLYVYSSMWKIALRFIFVFCPFILYRVRAWQVLPSKHRICNIYVYLLCIKNDLNCGNLFGIVVKGIENIL